MNRILTLLLLSGLTAIAACGGDHRRTAAATVGAAPGTTRQLELVCGAFFRTNPRAPAEPLGEIRLSGAADRSVRAGPFRFRAVYYEDRYESSSLSTYVYSNATGRQIEHSLFQFGSPRRLVNQFAGGHGFTGLRYVSDPGSAAELQYFCSRR